MKHARLKNPSILVNVIQGKQNISPGMLQGFIDALGLNLEEAQYFSLLVQLDRTEGEEQERVQERLKVLYRLHSAGLIQGPIFKFLSEWYYVAIRELAACSDFVPCPLYLAERMRPHIEPSQAENALKVLLDLGLLQQNDLGVLKPAQVSIRTDDDALDEATRRYHAAMISRAQEAIAELGMGGDIGKKTRFLGLTVAIPMSRMPLLIRTLHDMQKHLLSICDEPGDAPEEVYQIGLQLYPLTQTAPPPPKKTPWKKPSQKQKGQKKSPPQTHPSGSPDAPAPDPAQ